MAIACSTSAFKLSLDQALAEIESLGFKNVDLICIKGWNHILPSDLAENWEGAAGEVTRLLRKHALKPIACNVSVGNLYQRSAEVNAQRLREVHGVARMMCHLGVKVASFYPGYKVEESAWEDAFRNWVVTWEEMQSAAEEAGVQFVVELHMHTVLQSMAQCRRLFDALPDVRIAYDPSHFVMQGLDLHETAPLLDRTAHVHLRDAALDKMYERTGEGETDFAYLFDALEERGYRGHYSVECLAGEDPGLVREDVRKLKAILDERFGGYRGRQD